MADDILTPIILIPNFTKLFVIDLFDSAFSRKGVWESQKQDIKQCLVDGNNEKSFDREIEINQGHNHEIYSIDEPCKIIRERDENNCWRLRFLYKGKKRELIFFHHTNFISKWDEKIKEINHIMCIGTPFPINEEPLKRMLTERTISGCLFYDDKTKVEDTVKKSIMGKNVSISNLNSVLESNYPYYQNQENLYKLTNMTISNKDRIIMFEEMETDSREDIISWHDIDAGVREIVYWFNKINGWRTHESCEGHDKGINKGGLFISFSVLGIQGIRQVQMLESLFIENHLYGFSFILGPFFDSIGSTTEIEDNEVVIFLVFEHLKADDVASSVIKSLKILSVMIDEEKVPKGKYIEY